MPVTPRLETREVLDTTPRRATATVVAAVAAALAMTVPPPDAAPATAAPATAAQPGLVTAAPSQQRDAGRRAASVRRITPRAFGIHSYQGKPDVPTGSLRVNCGPSWAVMNPKRGVFDWTKSDQALWRAKSYGANRILFAFCLTPQWAAKRGMPANVAPPRKMVYWRDFVRAFVTRYRGVVDEYEVWNEATSRYWWQGTPAQMATMTGIAYRTIRRLDPTALVASASIQCCEHPSWFRAFNGPYLRALALRKWPVDALTFHTYIDVYPGRSLAKAAGRRTFVLRTIRKAIQPARVPRRVQLWDTETNFLVPSKPAVQNALVARTFLESFRFGFTRTYWYMFTMKPDPWLGIQMSPGSPASRVYRRMWQLTKGGQLRRCVGNSAVVCTFRRSGRQFQIAYTAGLKQRATIRLRGKARVCGVTSGKCVTRKGRARIGFSPVLVRGREIKS